MQSNYHQFEILNTGPSKVGKTAILTRFVYDIYNENISETIAVEFNVKTLVRETEKLQRPIFVLLKYQDSINSLMSDNKDQMEVNGQTRQRVFILVGNKADLNQCRQISQDEGLQMARDLNCFYTEVSSKDNTGIQEMFNVIIRAALAKEQQVTVQSKKPAKTQCNCF